MPVTCELEEGLCCFFGHCNRYCDVVNRSVLGSWTSELRIVGWNFFCRAVGLVPGTASAMQSWFISAMNNLVGTQ